MQWQQYTVPETLKKLGVSAEKGLSETEAAHRRRRDGPNRLRAARRETLLHRFLMQFSDFMVLILLAAAGVSLATSFLEKNGDFLDPIMILSIVVLNAIIGTVQESRAEKALESLQKLSAPVAHVRRGGKLTRIPAENVVAGDVMLLEEGDCIPADGRLISTTGFKTEESALTGESLPVEKDARLIFSAQEPAAECRNLVFAGTNAAAGSAWAVVTETGMNTQMGHIASLLDAGDAPQTPLQQKLAKTGKILGLAAVAICAAIFVMGLFQHRDPLTMFMISVSLAVAAIPEGLPAVVTIVLALGVRRMAARRAIIRRLPAVETLGCATVICSDKTGTLTQNKMEVTALTDAFGALEAQTEAGRQLLGYGARCCSVRFADGASAGGDPTERAIVAAAEAAGVHVSGGARIDELPFDSTRKRMTVVCRVEGRVLAITKGAPEIVVGLCDTCMSGGQTQRITPETRDRICRLARTLSERALRVIAVAVRELPPNASQADYEQALCWVGMIGMMDPPRPEVPDAVQTCRRAGIRPVMITGDHAATAAAIARQIGILTADDAVLTGAQLDAMPDEELRSRAAHCTVYARVSPEHKVRIVRALQQRGEVVAMTGDGVNDAPALKAADIGCAMGQSGTEVAKSAADMVLTDDCFGTIVAAVEEGRGIYANIRKAVHFLLSCNIGEILTVFAASLMHLPVPLLAIQLLWVNLVTDSLPALALGVEPADRDVMRQKPVRRGRSLFSGGLGIRIVLEGALIGSLALLAFTLGRAYFDVSPQAPQVARTMTFAVLSLSQLVHAFNMRSDRSVFEIGVFKNRKMVGAFLVGVVMQVSVITIPPLAAVFRTVPLTAVQWAIVTLLSFVPLAAVELEKLPHRRR